MLGWLRKPRRRKQLTGRLPVVLGAEPAWRRLLEGRFDAAQTTDENRRHWANADALSADAAASPDVRRVLRNRARYEVANNSCARGIVLTLANDVIGTGPRLQLLTDSPEINRKVEQAFTRWSAAAGLAEKLRTMRMARAQDGEAFCMLTANPLLASPVKLDIRLVEADQVATPDLSFRQAEDSAADGIAFDEHGNPVQYHVLKAHPGSSTWPAAGSGADCDRIPAESMLHWFRADRPGQHRGLPDLLPALPLFALRRRYQLAVITSAETAANYAAILKSSAPAGMESAEVEAMATIEIERNMLTVMPEGWDLSQVRSEQPATTYAEFDKAILKEIARCLNMPYNIAAGDSSDHNYASGRLDHQTYFKSIRVEQAQLGQVVMDRIFAAWVAEAELLTEFAFLRGEGELPHQWFWDGTEHVDPAKEATAQERRLRNNTTTLADEYAKQGKDWEVQLRQRAKEKQLMKELGLAESDVAPSARSKQATPSAPKAEVA